MDEGENLSGYPLHTTNLSRLAETHFILTNQEALRSKEILITGIGRIRRIKSKASECGEITHVWFLWFYPIHPVYPCSKKV